MSGNDFLGVFYEKPQKPYGFSWLEGVQTGQETENLIGARTGKHSMRSPSSADTRFKSER